MLTQEKIYNDFKEKCDDICEAKYIMSNYAINALLRFIPLHDSLMEFISKCNQGLNYNTLFKQATQEKIFKMPYTIKEQVALVSGILFNIDRGLLDLSIFLEKYFYAEDYKESYQNFCKIVIKPYAKAFENIEAPLEIDSLSDFDEKAGIVNSNLKEQMFLLIESLSEHVITDKILQETKRKECLIMLEGLYYAFEMSSSKLIITVWVGIKSVFANYKSANSYLLSMQKLLKMYDIL